MTDPTEGLDRFLAGASPPAGLDSAAQALWWAAKGDWERAHQLVQAHEGEKRADWVHAHLHRREGDESNARYWYRAAGQAPASGDLDAEWRRIVQALLAPHPASR